MSYADEYLVQKKRKKLEKLYKNQLTLKKADRRQDLPEIKDKLFRFNRWLKDLTKNS